MEANDSEKEKKHDNTQKETEKFTIAEIRKYYAETTAKLKEIDDMIENLESESKNNETTNQVKKEIEKKMIKFDPNKDKIHQLKPVPKENHNIKTNISENQKTNANPFGVVLKKINKTKDEK